MPPLDSPFGDSFRRVVDYVDSMLVRHTKGKYPGFSYGNNREDSLRPTNITYLDELLGGGLIPGRVFGLLGMMGGCKTTLAVQLSCSMAMQAYSRSRSSQHLGSLGRCYLFSLEDRPSQLRVRAAAYSAQVPRCHFNPRSAVSRAELPLFEHKLIPKSASAPTSGSKRLSQH